MRPVRISLAPDAADRNGIAQAQTTAGAGNLTLNGALAGTMDVPRHVSVYCVGDISGVTFTVTGTDRYGIAITEDIAGPDTTPDTNKGSKNFATITQVYADGAVGTAVEVGSADEMELPWVPIDYNYPVGTVQVELSSATLTFAWQTTADDVSATGFQENDAAVTVDATITGKTASIRGSDTQYATASRLAITGFSAGSLVATFMQGTQ